MAINDILNSLKESNKNKTEKLNIGDDLGILDTLKIDSDEFNVTPEETIENDEEFKKIYENLDNEIDYSTLEGGDIPTLSDTERLQNITDSIYYKLDELNEEFLLVQPMEFIDKMLERGYIDLSNTNTFFLATKVSEFHLADIHDLKDKCIVIITQNTNSILSNNSIKIFNKISTEELIEIFVYDSKLNIFKEYDE